MWHIPTPLLQFGMASFELYSLWGYHSRKELETQYFCFQFIEKNQSTYSYLTVKVLLKMPIVGCYGLNHCPSTNSYVEGLTPSVKAFGDKIYRKQLRWNAVVRMVLWFRRIGIYKKRHRDLTLPISMSLCV